MVTSQIRSLQYQITNLISIARQMLHTARDVNLSSNLGLLGAFTDMNIPDSKGSLGELGQFGNFSLRPPDLFYSVLCGV